MCMVCLLQTSWGLGWVLLHVVLSELCCVVDPLQMLADVRMVCVWSRRIQS